MSQSLFTKKLLRGALLMAAIAACDSGTPDGQQKDDPNGNQDIVEALNALPEATVLLYNDDGIPQYIIGELGKIDATQTDALIANDARLRPALPPILKAFRLTNDDLVLRKINTDDDGARHFRYTQKAGGLDVVGGDFIVHVDARGAITGVNGTARGNVPQSLTASMTESAVNARIAGDARFAGMKVTGSRQVFVQTNSGEVRQAFEQIVEGKRGQDPVRDKVFVDVTSGEIVAVHPQIFHARNRRTYSANNGTSLPGTLKLTETQTTSGDVQVDRAHANTATVYDAFKAFFNRDSIDNAGMDLVSTVHYSTNYCNAFWNSSQMTYGDGNASQGCAPLANSLDVAGHEIGHGITERESGLVYSGESGGLNESYSDIYGAFTEAYKLGGMALSLDPKVFLIGDEVLPPALRYMCDPAADGVSRDVWSSTLGSVDVHYSSGPNNLAFCLMVKGGTHPRGKTTNNVPAIGFDKTIRILMKANVDLLTSSSKYAQMRTAAEQAAAALYPGDTATKDAVSCAYAAIAVGTAPTSCGGTPPPPPPGDTVLSNGVALGSQSDSVVGNFKFYKLTVPAGQTSLTFQISGGTGDADMYVQQGAHPSSTVYQCRPYLGGNAETCTFTNPVAGDWFVGLNAYSAYSGLTIKGTYAAGGTNCNLGGTVLTNGVAKTGLAGALNSNTNFCLPAVPAGKTLTIKITPGTGSTGDADLYTRQGALPTTSTYACRPYLSGNTETCTASTTTAGDWYVMLRGFSAYTNVSLVGSY